MNTFFRWLLSVPNPDDVRSVTLWVDMGRGAVRVGKVRLKRGQLAKTLEEFDGLNHLTLPVEEEDA